MNITEREKFLILLLVAMVIWFIQTGIVSAYAEHFFTRYSVKSGAGPNGETVFEHEDKETTEILNYLSGREDLPKEKKLELAKKMIKAYLKIQGREVPKDIDSMDENNLKAVCDSFKLCVDVIAIAKPWMLPGQSWFEPLIGWPPKYDEKLYLAIWEIERIGGNPKIRWSEGIGMDFRGEGIFNTYYRHDTNTIYLQLPTCGALCAVEDFVAEAAHGKQFSDNPVKKRFLRKRELIVAESAALILGVPQYVVLDTFYNKPGTIEYEAHRVIEPELRKKLPVMFFASPQPH